MSASSCSAVGWPGIETTMLLAALGGDLGLGDAVGVDALADDVDGPVDLALADRLGAGELGLEHELRAALEVEAEAGGHGPAAPLRQAGGEAAEGEDDDDERQEAPSRRLLGGAACHESLTDRSAGSPGSYPVRRRPAWPVGASVADARRRAAGGRRVGLLHRDGAPVHADGRALGDLEPGGAVVEMLDDAVDARRGDDPVADVERRAEVAHLLHPLVLGEEQPAQQQQGQGENQQREGPVVVHVSSVLRVIVRALHARVTTRAIGSDVASTTGGTGWCRGSGDGARRSLRAPVQFVRPDRAGAATSGVTFWSHSEGSRHRARSALETRASGLVDRQRGGPERLRVARAG